MTAIFQHTHPTIPITIQTPTTAQASLPALNTPSVVERPESVDTSSGYRPAFKPHVIGSGPYVQLAT